MLTVALTGGIATGKSVVASVLKKQGCVVQSADRVARNLMKPGRVAWQKIVDHFGPHILNPDRTINRPKLAAIIFSSVKERQFVNRLIHPLVLEKKKQTVRQLAKKGLHKIFVSEAALTIESGFIGFFDKIVVVTCPERIQLKRLMERDRISRQEAWKRIRSQMPSAKKAKQADYVIDTSGSLEETIRQSEVLYGQLLDDYQKKNKKDVRPPRTGLRLKAKQPEAGS
ncbi:MAG: dephospho-CoA kinase [Clostridiales bacterium]|nr:dephospho-CoA kinase [Clostridiales bacterium]